MRLDHTKRAKIVITVGVIAPSLARLIAPGSEELMRTADIVALLTAVMWVWEV